MSRSRACRLAGAIGPKEQPPSPCSSCRPIRDASVGVPPRGMATLCCTSLTQSIDTTRVSASAASPDFDCKEHKRCSHQNAYHRRGHRAKPFLKICKSTSSIGSFYKVAIENQDGLVKRRKGESGNDRCQNFNQDRASSIYLFHRSLSMVDAARDECTRLPDTRAQHDACAPLLEAGSSVTWRIA